MMGLLYDAQGRLRKGQLYINRGHSLTIDHGWREVAETALAFIAQQLKTGQ
jgi:hypothetical protein